MTSLLQKGFNIFIRTMAKPIIKWVLDHKKTDILGNVKVGKIGKVFIYIGQKHNILSTKINRKILGLSNISEIKDLPEEKALEKGTEFCSEILVYSILIFVPIIEWRKQAKNAEIKEKKELENLEKIKKNLERLSKEDKLIEAKYNLLKQKIVEVDEIYNKKFYEMSENNNI